MSLAIEICHDGLIDSSHQLPVAVTVDGKQFDLSNLCRNSSKKHTHNRKSLCQERPQSNPNEKVSVEPICRLDQMIRKSELGQRRLSERTQQRSNRTHPQQRPFLVLDGDKYDLSNLCIDNSKKQFDSRKSLYPFKINVIEKGSVEKMCRLDRMIRKGEIFRRRQGERSQRPPVVIVDGEQWDVSNLFREGCESLYPDLSQLCAIDEDSANNMSRLHQTIRSSQVRGDRFRERSQRGPPVIHVDGKEYDLSNLCSSNSKNNLDNNQSIFLELPMESLYVKETPGHDKRAYRHAGGEEEEVWQVDFPLHDISIMLPHAEVESVVTDTSFASLDLSSRGPLETIKALGKECFACAECMECSKPLHCTDDAELILCPKCQCVGVKAYGIKGGRCDSPFPKKGSYGIKGGGCDSPYPKTGSHAIGLGVESPYHRVLRPPSHYRLNCPSS